MDPLNKTPQKLKNKNTNRLKKPCLNGNFKFFFFNVDKYL